MKKINLLIILGLIVFVAGFYFSFVMAGLPFQDATNEMMKTWMFYDKTGKILLFTGFGISLLGVILKIVKK